MRLTQKNIKKHISYNPTTGQFIWEQPTSNRVKIGDVVGTITVNGYLSTSIKNHRVYLHRLAWLYVYGEIPKEIDHINHNRLDNRIENLRKVTRAENLRNVSMRSDNSTGHTGVYKDARSKNISFYYLIQKDGIVHKKFGFKTIEEADSAVKEARIDLGFHQNHGDTSINMVTKIR